MHAARPSATSASASDRVSKSTGNVVRATTHSLIDVIFLLYRCAKPVTTLLTMSESGAVTPDTPARPTGRRQLRSRQDVRDRRRRFITYGLLAGSAILVVDALVGEG